jgi:hypothetical protein
VLEYSLSPYRPVLVEVERGGSDIGGGLGLLHADSFDEDGDGGRFLRGANVGLFGRGEGSCHRYRKGRLTYDRTGKNACHTRNSKSCAPFAMTVISWAVEALCMAFAPGLANDTLPTSTLCTTVLKEDQRLAATILD